MATAYTVNITPDNTGLWHITQNEAAARKATELLNKDIETHHIFFNDDGFHNHLSHQILALFGTGASTEALVKNWKENITYQRPATKAHENLVEEFKDWEKAKERLGKGQYYNDWLLFYQREIERLGWQGTLSEYLFKGDERSEDMLIRMLAGFVHPLIQLMYGVEWAQPAIVAMALAQASVHKTDFRDFYLETDRRAKESDARMPPIVELLEAARANAELRASPRLSDGNKIRDGVLQRAQPAAVALASRVRVRPEELAERTAEMYHAGVYEAACAAVHGDRDPKFEFFLIHHVNVAPIFLTLNAQDWVPEAVKVRLLEWKIRLDLLQYVARGSPELGLEKISGYVPAAKNPGPFAGLLPRMHNLVEDGHAIKLFRAVGIGRDYCKPFEDRGCDWVLIRGDLWDKVGHLVADSVEAPGPTWVRNCGFDEAWVDVQAQQRGGVNGRL